MIHHSTHTTCEITPTVKTLESSKLRPAACGSSLFEVTEADISTQLAQKWREEGAARERKSYMQKKLKAEAAKSMTTRLKRAQTRLHVHLLHRFSPQL